MPEPPAAPRPRGTGWLALASVLDVDSAVRISGVGLDSRRIVPGDLYVALPGQATHGARFAAAAVAAGAVAVLTDAEGAGLAGDLGVPVLTVPDPRSKLARVAAAVNGWPATQLLMLGVTGTTGKTSTTFLLEAGLAAAGKLTGTIGTIGFRLGGEELPAVRSTITTPEAPDLQALLALLRDRGADAVAMEVSSHALALHRTDAITFDVAGFTNLGRDHLDFHHDQEQYYLAKRRLFTDGRCRRAVVNTDDVWGRRLVDRLRTDGTPFRTTGSTPDADYRVTSREPLADGRTRLRLATPSGEHAFVLGLLGEFNVRNALTAAAMLDCAGVELATALAGFATASIPGRMQRVPLPGDAPNVVVDFAHTPESVAAALASLPGGPVTAVLGCGGDRDRAKREPMGEAAAGAARLVVVTDDNPRSEDPAAIRQAVLAGARRAAAETGAEVLDGGDRRSAIRMALRRTGPEQWVAILGKGHERGQDIGGVVTPFDDVAVAQQEWAAIRQGGGHG
ncbi:MAG: UDP-N-acetylmuramoyl-L-alanyl-D-glutamate--2,6-diaminopimelate ligase [Propionicimonas sp.]|nr:UDP-N-acetylmuramoyl-L-alanyl-D-glutamate--2,6-diaminopimelate ligase [Propionicimonas sp.]MEA4943012.1 UDP-N-acetylmuramoyl-L-alanyl-D-glutamate--2,6-diaminopimelate ligase [Propionicimonas sp.]